MTATPPGVRHLEAGSLVRGWLGVHSEDRHAEDCIQLKKGLHLDLAAPKLQC